MKKTKLIWLSLLLIAISLSVSSQPVTSNPGYIEYIEKFRDIAIKKMHEYKIPASITLAQGILESGMGNSELAVNANNHFGIKCHKEWTGMTYTMDDDSKNECFRKYVTVEESFNDHSLFLTTRPRYSGLFELNIKDYKGWARGLKSAGYATNPKYADILIRIIEENKLYIYDDAPKGPYVDKSASKSTKKTTPASGPVESKHPSPGHARRIILTPANVKYVETGDANREIYLNNGVKLTFARVGDDAHVIAKDFGIHAFQILNYNELGKYETIVEGQVIYITPKKKKNSLKRHTVDRGENMKDISQYYGIKLKNLYKLNGMKSGEEPENGKVLKLAK